MNKFKEGHTVIKPGDTGSAGKVTDNIGGGSSNIEGTGV